MDQKLGQESFIKINQLGVASWSLCIVQYAQQIALQEQHNVTESVSQLASFTQTV
jgi:hypothetical protein